MPKYSTTTKKNISRGVQYTISYREGNRIVIQSTASRKVLMAKATALSNKATGFSVSMKKIK